MCLCQGRAAASAGLSIPDAAPPQLPLPLCRLALRRGTSPDLAAALQGVTEARLFLGGEVVRDGLPVQDLVDDAAVEGLTVVLPSGQGMGIVASAAPAVQL